MMVKEDEGQDSEIVHDRPWGYVSADGQRIQRKVNNELIERIIVNVKNGGKQASSYTVNLCRKEIDLAQHAKVLLKFLNLS